MVTENKEKKLQDKIQLLEAKIEELELEAAAVKKCSLFSQEQAQVNKRLKELQRRHNEFRRLLLGGQGPFSAGPAFLTSSQAPFVLLGSEGQFGNNPEDHGSEFSLLRQRLENLESAQQQQLEELGSLVQRDRSTTPQPEL